MECCKPFLLLACDEQQCWNAYASLRLEISPLCICKHALPCSSLLGPDGGVHRVEGGEVLDQLSNPTISHQRQRRCGVFILDALDCPVLLGVEQRSKVVKKMESSVAGSHVCSQGLKSNGVHIRACWADCLFRLAVCTSPVVYLLQG